MIESLTSKGTELTSSKSEFGKGFNPDSPAEISTKGSDVHAPFPRENKEPEFDPRFNPDERISIGDKIPMDGEGDKWERHESVEYRDPIEGSGLPHPPPIMNETSLPNNAFSEVNANPDSRAEVPKTQNMDNSQTEVDKSRLDDNGKEYKDENGDLLPNSEYTVNGTTYHTDELGRIIDWEGELKDTPENGRDEGAQAESGGKDRKEGDDGGHLQGRQNGGAAGNENLVPMRDTVNRGDYLKTENEENQMLKDGKKVTESGEVSYNGDSTRPSKIHKEYSDGEKTVKADFDNDFGSKDLLDKLENDITDEDLQSLKDEISDMEADGNEVSVTSVKKEYDSDGNLKSTTVGIRNETTGEKYYRTFSN